jgi:antitoxin ParD1/3/4
MEHYHQIPNIGTCGGAMAKNTSISLGDHFDSFIAQQLQSGRYGSASEVIRAALRMLEKSETKLERLRRLLEEGEKSGFEDYSYDALVAELDDESH